MDVVQRGTARADRGRVLKELDAWLAGLFGRAPADRKLFERALTHGSSTPANYERLEFLGDRVLGLTIAEWLYELFPDEPEGKLSKRLNTLVSGQTCAAVARGWGVGARLVLGKQARDDGAADSDYVLGDVAEALIGAWYIDAGWPAARNFVRGAWADRVSRDTGVPHHPKSALQEWASAKGRKPPVYEVVERSGPGHAPRFAVRVAVGKLTAEASGGSKQEAETEAARVLLGMMAG